MIKLKLKESVRFWSRIDKSADCWLYKGRLDKDGYGMIDFRGTGYRCHRISYSIAVGDPGEYHVLHKCDVRNCVNPDHLFIGTHLDNMRDAVTKGRNYTGGSGTKLTLDKEEELRVLKKQGLSNQELSDRFSLAIVTVSRIINRRRKCDDRLELTTHEAGVHRL